MVRLSPEEIRERAVGVARPDLAGGRCAGAERPVRRADNRCCAPGSRDPWSAAASGVGRFSGCGRLGSALRRRRERRSADADIA